METHNLFTGIRVVGFDLDQTLYPKSPLIDEKIQAYLYEKIAEHRGVNLAEGERLFKERYQEGAGMSGSQSLADLGLANGSELVQEALEHADLTSVLSPDPDTKAFILRLREKFEGVDILTGSNLEQTKKKLAVLDLGEDLFNHIITQDESSKSTGASYKLWFSLYPDVRPDEFLYIGDRARSDHDVPSALEIRTCLVYVKEVNPEVTATQLKDFKELFGYI